MSKLAATLLLQIVLINLTLFSYQQEEILFTYWNPLTSDSDLNNNCTQAIRPCGSLDACLAHNIPNLVVMVVNSIPNDSYSKYCRQYSTNASTSVTIQSSTNNNVEWYCNELEISILPSGNTDLLVQFKRMNLRNFFTNGVKRNRIEFFHSSLAGAKIENFDEINMKYCTFSEGYSIGFIDFRTTVISNSSISKMALYFYTAGNSTTDISSSELKDSYIFAQSSVGYLEDLEDSFWMTNTFTERTNIHIDSYSIVIFSGNVHKGSLSMSELKLYSSRVTTIDLLIFPRFLTIDSIMPGTFHFEALLVSNMEYGGFYVHCLGSKTTIVDSIFENCESEQGSALNVISSLYTDIENTIFRNNRQSSKEGGGGGAIATTSSFILCTNTTFLNNSATGKGGAIYNMNGHGIIDSSRFEYNQAAIGGAISFVSETNEFQKLSIFDIEMTNNIAQLGGAMFWSGILVDWQTGIGKITKNRAILGGGFFFNNIPFLLVDDALLTSTKQFEHIVYDNIGEANENVMTSPIELNLTGIPSQIELGTAYPLELNIKDQFGNIIPYRSQLMTIVGEVDNFVIQVQQSNTGIEIIVYSVFEKFNEAPNVTFTLGMIQGAGKTLSLQPQLIHISQCGPLFKMGVGYVQAKGNFYYCTFDYTYLVIFIGIPLAIAVVCISLFIACIFSKFRTMGKKVKVLHEKELAEEELKQKLLDLQIQYGSNSESRYSYKDWIIRIQDIHIERKLGEGGYGKVFLGSWRNTPVALKSIKLDDIQLDSNEFEHEASLLSSLRNPNIVQFYGVVLTESTKFMVTEYMEGGSLDELIFLCNKGLKSLTWKRKLDILMDIASGMSYMHHDRSSIIIHRDLKPANILLTSNLVAKVSDFGFSKLIDAAAKSQTFVGTFLYCAPEVLLGKKYNHLSDVYSFSLIMWQLLFDETELFNFKKYSLSPKFASIMNQTHLGLYEEYSLSIPFQIAQNGIRLPIPDLPISESDSEWLSRTFCNSTFGFKANEIDRVVQIMNIFFGLIHQCWNLDLLLLFLTCVIARSFKFKQEIQTCTRMYFK